MIEHVSEDCTCIGRECTGCKLLLCFGRFAKQKKGKYGLNSKCRTCNGKENAAWREKNHEYNLQRMRTYHQSHKEEESARYKAWRQKNLEYDSERHKRYNSENAERLRQQQKEHRRKNRPAIRERERVYWARHREQKKEKGRRNYWRHSEARSEYTRTYRREHLEQVRARERAYRLANRARTRAHRTAYLKLWHMKHPRPPRPLKVPRKRLTRTPRKRFTQEQRKEARRTTWQRHYLKYREHHNQRVREWQRNNPEKHSAQQAKRRTLKTQVGGFFTAEEWNALCAEYNHTCLACGRSGMQLTADHIIPVLKGGHSYISNIQPLCKSCNSSKGTKVIDYRNSREDYTR